MIYVHWIGTYEQLTFSRMPIQDETVGEEITLKYARGMVQGTKLDVVK